MRKEVTQLRKATVVKHRAARASGGQSVRRQDGLHGSMARDARQAAVSAYGTTEPSRQPWDEDVIPCHQMWKLRPWEVNKQCVQN